MIPENLLLKLPYFAGRDLKIAVLVDNEQQREALANADTDTRVIYTDKESLVNSINSYYKEEIKLRQKEFMDELKTAFNITSPKFNEFYKLLESKALNQNCRNLYDRYRCIARDVERWKGIL